jgi:hypothetical protein
LARTVSRISYDALSAGAALDSLDLGGIAGAASGGKGWGGGEVVGAREE